MRYQGKVFFGADPCKFFPGHFTPTITVDNFPDADGDAKSITFSANFSVENMEQAENFCIAISKILTAPVPGTFKALTPSAIEKLESMKDEQT